MKYKLTDKGRQALNIGSSLILAAIEDKVPLSKLPFTSEEREQILKELEGLGYVAGVDIIE